MEHLPEKLMPAPDSDSDSEEKGAMFLEKRALNIKENKAMASTQCLPGGPTFFPPSPPLTLRGSLWFFRLTLNGNYVNALRRIYICIV